LAEELESTRAHSKNEAGRLVNPLTNPEFQADALMMGQAVSGETLIVVTNDADIPTIARDC